MPFMQDDWFLQMLTTVSLYTANFFMSLLQKTKKLLLQEKRPNRSAAPPVADIIAARIELPIKFTLAWIVGYAVVAIRGVKHMCVLCMFLLWTAGLVVAEFVPTGTEPAAGASVST